MRISLLLYFLLEIAEGVEWGGGTELEWGDLPPEDQLDRNAGLSTADHISKRCGEGRLFLLVVFLLFFVFFFCKSVKESRCKEYWGRVVMGQRRVG